MQKNKRSNNSTENILDAAQQVAAQQGAAKVSMDTVAKKAGLTKGGVLYNFPSKEALVSGMLERLISAYTPKVNTYEASLTDSPNPSLQAVIHAVRELEEVNPNIFMAILAAAAHNLDLLQPWRDLKVERYTKIRAQATAADEASILWAASEGLMLLDMLGVLPFDSEHKAYLLGLLEEKAQQPI